jgi:hypothetical protein
MQVHTVNYREYRWWTTREVDLEQLLDELRGQLEGKRILDVHVEGNVLVVAVDLRGVREDLMDNIVKRHIGA